ncbi:hypothetical protein ACFQHN_16240 [Natrialbaceae archaeon GCM10025896]
MDHRPGTEVAPVVGDARVVTGLGTVVVRRFVCATGERGQADGCADAGRKPPTAR